MAEPDYRQRGQKATALPIGGAGTGVPAPAMSPVTASPRPEAIPAGPWSPNAGPVGQTAPAPAALPAQGHIGDPGAEVQPQGRPPAQEAIPVSTAKPVKDEKGKPAKFSSTTYDKFSEWADKHRDAARSSGRMERIIETEQFISGTYHKRFIEHMQKARVQLWSGDSYGSAESLAKAYSYMPNGKQSVFQILDDGSIRANATDEKSGEKGRNVFTLKPQSRETDRFFANMIMNFEDPQKFATWTLNRDKLDIDTAKTMKEFGLKFDNADAANRTLGDIAASAAGGAKVKKSTFSADTFRTNVENMDGVVGTRADEVADSPNNEKDRALAQYYDEPDFKMQVKASAANIMGVNIEQDQYLPDNVIVGVSELLTAFDKTVDDKATPPNMKLAPEIVTDPAGNPVYKNGHLMVEYLSFKVLLPPGLGNRLRAGYEKAAKYQPPQVVPEKPGAWENIGDAVSALGGAFGGALTSTITGPSVPTAS